MTYELKPYIGISDFCFGATQAQIKKVGGEAALIEIDNIMKETRERRSGMIFGYEKRRLIRISVSKHVPITLNGNLIFPDCNPLEVLSAYDKAIEGSNATLLFKELGICLGGFTKERIPEGKLLIAFAKEMLPFYEGYIDV